MLYLPRAWLRAALACERDDTIGFRATLGDDDRLGQAIRSACAAMFHARSQLECDAAIDAVSHQLWPHLGSTGSDGAPTRDPDVVRRASERLLGALAENISADTLAREAGAADRFQLARAFRAAYGASPHEWLVQMRLLRARRLLARGERPAAVAASCGFADQSHFGRWFRRAYGVTPGVYCTGCTGVPDGAPADLV